MCVCVCMCRITELILSLILHTRLVFQKIVYKRNSFPRWCETDGADADGDGDASGSDTDGND